MIVGFPFVNVKLYAPRVTPTSANLVDDMLFSYLICLFYDVNVVCIVN